MTKESKTQYSKKKQLLKIFLLILILLLTVFIFLIINVKLSASLFIKSANNTVQAISNDTHEIEIDKLTYQLQNANREIISLKNELNVLKDKTRYKDINQQQLQTVYLLLDIQTKIKNKQPFNTELEQLRTLMNNNTLVDEKIDKLIPYSTTNIPNETKILVNFQNEMNQALKLNSTKENIGIKNKIKNLFRRLITIRKVSDKYNKFEIDSLDLWLLKIEKALNNKDYRQALIEINNNLNYAEYLKNTKKALEDLTTVNQNIEELLDYNQTLMVQ
jgi:hypothetical protein